MGFKIESCTSDNGLREASILLHKFFFGGLDYVDYFRKLSDSTLKDVSVIDLDGGFASRVFMIKNEDGAIGSGEVRVFPATKLSGQLLIMNDGESIWLSKMGRELVGLNFSTLAVELAYFAIEPEFRSKGVGSEVFYGSILSTLGDVDSVCCSLFTVAKGVYAGSGMGQQVRDYLLSVERENNGTTDGSYVIVSGTRIPLGEVERKFRIDSHCFKPRDESVATQILAERWGWNKLGLSKNLSPVYGLTVFLS